MKRDCPPTRRPTSPAGTTQGKSRSGKTGKDGKHGRRSSMIPLDRYPKEITLRDDARVVLRPMIPEDADGLWSFLRQLPEIDKSHFHEDVDRLLSLIHISEPTRLG